MKKLERSNALPGSIAWYLDQVENLGFEFDCLTPYSTAGDILAPYAYQWVARTIVYGDDPYEGVGGTTIDAIKDLYRLLKKI